MPADSLGDLRGFDRNAYAVVIVVRSQLDPTIVRDTSSPEFHAVEEEFGALQTIQGSTRNRHYGRGQWFR